MSFLIRVLTWVDHTGERAATAAFRGIAAVLTRVLRRGRHRPWRAGQSAS